jgi:maleate isomerase
MKRIGVIVPSSNTTVETEFTNSLRGSRISLHTARIPLQDVTVEALSAMEKETAAVPTLL